MRIGLRPRAAAVLLISLLMPLAVQADMMYGPTVNGETLWGIALKLQPQYPGSETAQIALALLDANPQGRSEDGRLRTGVTLNLPTVDAVRSEPVQPALLAQRMRTPLPAVTPPKPAPVPVFAVPAPMRVAPQPPPAPLVRAAPVPSALVAPEGATALPLPTSEPAWPAVTKPVAEPSAAELPVPEAGPVVTAPVAVPPVPYVPAPATTPTPLVLPAPAALPSAGTAAVPEAINDEGAAELVESLVRVAPYRFAGSQANLNAAAWAMNTLRKAGFKNVHGEPVSVPHWVRGCATRPAAPSPTAADCPDGDALAEIAGDTPQRLVATALGGSVGTPTQGVTAPVLMLASFDELIKRPPADIKGHIVFINQRMARAADGSGYGPAVNGRVRGPAEAGRRGAVAFVLRSLGTAHDRVPHTGALRYDDVAPKIAAAALSDIDADTLEQSVNAGGEVQLHLRVDARDLGKAQGLNVIGEIPGSDPHAGIVLLAAHLDSWDITPGANDDAAGVAIVISALRKFIRSGEKPRRTLRLLLAESEEFGVYGAKAYAQAHAAEIGRHVLAMEADFGSGPVQTLSAGVMPADWPQVQRMAAALRPLGVTIGSNGSGGGADVSPLRERGVPVLVPRQDGSAYFDVHHSAKDTLDTIDRAGLAQAVNVYASLAWTVAQMPEPLARLPAAAP